MRVFLLNPPYFKRYSRQSRSPCVTKGGTFYYPYFLSYATGALEKAGYTVRLRDAVAGNLGREEVIEEAEKFAPELVVLDTSTPSIYNDVEVASLIKDTLPDAHVTLVGTHPTAMPEETMALSDKLDSVCLGEYDYTLADLAAAVGGDANLAKVRGLCYRSNGEVYKNAPRELIKNLDELPFVSEVYKKHLNIKDYFYASLLHPQVTILTARGCPYNCSFCNAPYKNSYRARSVDNVLDEFEYIQRELPEVKEVMIEDETFPARKRRTLELCAGLRERGIKLRWSCNARVNTDYETLKAMKEAGCRLLCTPPDTLIITNSGQKPIKDIKVGEKVLTHSKKFKKVTKVFTRKYSGKLIKIKPYYLQPLSLTPEHPVLFIHRKKIFCKKVKGICHPYHSSYKCSNCKEKKFEKLFSLAEWVKAKDLKKGFLILPIPSEVHDIKELKISKILSEHSPLVINYQKLVHLRNGGMSIKNISESFQFPKSSIGKYLNPDYETALNKAEYLNSDLVKLPYEHSFVRNNIEINEDFCLLAGYFAAEGSVLISEKKKMYRITFTFNLNEKGRVDKVCNLINKLFGIKPSVYVNKHQNKREVVIHSKTLTLLFKKFFGENSLNRRIPQFFLYLPVNKQLKFLNGLLRGDGSVKKEIKQKMNRISYMTVSKDLFFSAYIMLLRGGIFPSTYHIKRKNVAYIMNIDGYHSLERLKEVFNEPIYKGKFERKFGFIHDAYGIVPIRRIEKEDYDGIVMNLEVEDDESYVANMLSVHNCVGFETPTQLALDSVHKGTTKELQMKFMGNAKTLGLLVNGCFMLGLPGDSVESIKDTVEFAKKLNPDTAQFYPLMVYPGTGAYRWAREKGYLITEDYSKWIDIEGKHATTVSYPGLSSEELVELCDSARKGFYLRREYIFYKIAQGIRSPSEALRTLKSAKTFFRYLAKNIFS